MARDTVDPTNIVSSKRVSKTAPHLLDPANSTDEADIAREVQKRKEAPKRQGLAVDDDSHDVSPSTAGILHTRGNANEADQAMPSTKDQVQETRASEWIFCYSHFFRLLIDHPKKTLV